RRCAHVRSSCASPERDSAKATSTTCRSPRNRRITGWVERAAALPSHSSAGRDSGSAPVRPQPILRQPVPPPMTDIHSDKILILDFGAQYTQLIARRIREIGVYCEIRAWDHDPSEIAAFGAKGIILSGGPESTTLPGAPA